LRPALLGYTQLGVVNARDGLSDDLDRLAGDFLLVRIFAVQLTLDKDVVAQAIFARRFRVSNAVRSTNSKSDGSIRTTAAQGRITAINNVIEFLTPPKM
jgi:hypothetical protein